MKKLLLLFLPLTFFLLISIPVNASYLPITTYVQASDSPFNGLSLGYFYLEDFEDHSLNTPGVSANRGGPTSVIFGPSLHDSVDADDGVIDGSGLGGDSFFYSGGARGIEFSFDQSILGSLPTHVGIVWTDGNNSIEFTAYDAVGNSLGTISGSHADGSHNGTTVDDRFYGVIDLGGISSIFIKNGSGGIEVDHLQYGGGQGGPPPIPEPATMFLFGIGLLGLAGVNRRKE